MSVLIASQVAKLSAEDKKNLIGAGLGLLNSAPIIAFGAAMMVNLQWNLEHFAFNGRERRFIRLSTKQAADVDHNDPNLTSLAPPLMSSAARLADDGLDVAASAASLAQKQIETVSQKGAIQGLFEFFFGSGG